MQNLCKCWANVSGRLEGANGGHRCKCKWQMFMWWKQPGPVGQSCLIRENPNLIFPESRVDGRLNGLRVLIVVRWSVSQCENYKRVKKGGFEYRSPRDLLWGSYWVTQNEDVNGGSWIRVRIVPATRWMYEGNHVNIMLPIQHRNLAEGSVVTLQVGILINVIFSHIRI